MNWYGKTGLVLEGGGMRELLPQECWTFSWIKTFLFTPVSACLQVPVMPAVIFPSREGEDLRPIRIIWMMKIIAALKAC